MPNTYIHNQPSMQQNIHIMKSTQPKAPQSYKRKIICPEFLERGAAEILSAATVPKIEHVVDTSPELVDCAWVSGRRVKNRGFDLTQKKTENHRGPVIFLDATRSWPLSLRVSRPNRFGKTFHQCSISGPERRSSSPLYGKSHMYV